ncbi:hypothetical protein HNY73_018974 [Argiope bruennichi]|uniref:Uncharacterized protein n=1 Tax=Argiope bruennichi TaxID=94029 RepID=A0A8T0EIV7_ARGBR|nr:hypothetical protein HNY73_018974 [Argiope bruennichi]
MAICFVEHAGTEDGFIDGAELVYKASSSSGDNEWGICFVVLAGTDDGFIDGAELVYRASSSSGDNCGRMSHQCVTKRFRFLHRQRHFKRFGP